jgi:hypothetical protein
VSDQFTGRRRRQSRVSVARVVALVVAFAVVGWLLALGDPGRQAESGPPPIAIAAPTWSGPQPVDVPGLLADGATYNPRLYLDPRTSVGVATAADGTVRVIMVSAAGSFTELHTKPPADHAQVNGFATDGDTLVWMESVSRNGSTTHSLWRTKWAPAGQPQQVVANAGDPRFSGLSTDVVVTEGKVVWASDSSGATDVRQVAVSGGKVTSARYLDGEFVPSAPPWAVTAPGNPVKFVNLQTGASMAVPTAPGEIAICNPTWCRVTVTTNGELAGIEMMRADGSGRVRIAGPESTPTIADPTLLDRFVPLATDRVEGVGLSLYDLRTGKTDLIAPAAANIGGRNGILWWSTGNGADLVWHAIDLRELP